MPFISVHIYPERERERKEITISHLLSKREMREWACFFRVLWIPQHLEKSETWELQYFPNLPWLFIYSEAHSVPNSIHFPLIYLKLGASSKEEGGTVNLFLCSLAEKKTELFSTAIFLNSLDLANPFLENPASGREVGEKLSGVITI